MTQIADESVVMFFYILALLFCGDKLFLRYQSQHFNHAQAQALCK
jgi:hypothetical protein